VSENKKSLKGLWATWQGMQLWKRVLLGLVLGVLVGSILGPYPMASQFETNDAYLAALGDVPAHIQFLFRTFDTIGTLFKNAFKMLIVPLVFFSLVSGVTSMDDLREMGRVGGKTFILYLLTTSVAVTIGLSFGFFFEPGAGVDLGAGEYGLDTNNAKTFGAFLIGLIPTNPMRAFAEGNVMQIITFAILIGVSINLAKEKAAMVRTLMDQASEVMIRLTHIVIQVTPYGVLALMAVISAQYGLAVLLPLGKLVLVVYFALIFHAVVVYGSFIKLAGLKLKPFFFGLFDAQLVAYSTASSAATLPVTLSCNQENLGVSKRISSFVLPLGATINMDGTALYMGIVSVFTAQAFGIDLTVSQGLTIILTCTLASIGTAAVPGASLVMLTMVLSSVGLPFDAIAFVFGVDRIMDMMRTAVNITGDSMVTTVIAKSEGELDQEIYNAAPDI
jgi:Na+/H+-dicarboxylate symporter